MTPSSYNGTWQVTACTTSSVSFSSTLTTAATTLGSIVKDNLINNILINAGVTAGSTIGQSLITNASTISSIVTTGVVPTPSFPATPITTNDQYNSAQLLLNNIPFIQAELTAFITANYPTVNYNLALSVSLLESAKL